MSSQSFRKPEFRLYLGYTSVSLMKAGSPVPVGTTRPDAPGFADDLRGFAAEVARERGRLIAVLPESEIWRGRPMLAGRTPWARRREALGIGARGLGVPPEAVAIVLGKAAADRTTPVIAVRRGTLDETRALMAKVDLIPAAIVGAGGFPGFPRPPRLDGWPSRLPALPALPRHHLALGTGAIAAAAAVVLAMPGNTPSPSPLPAPAIDLAAAMDEPAAPAKLVPVAPTPTALLRAEPPMPRPKSLALATALQPIVTQATRNVPLVLTEPRRGAPPELRLAELTTARVRTVDAEMTTPLRRPLTVPAPVPVEAAEPATVAGANDALRPLHRPQAPKATTPAKPEPMAAATPLPAVARPLPRPAAAKAEIPTLVVASLEPDTLLAESLAAAAAPMDRPALSPLARPASLRAPAAKAAPVAQPTVKVVTPRKVVPSVPKAAAAPVPVVKAAPRVVTAPVRQAALATTATPQRVVAKPVPVAAVPKAATERLGLSRGNMALIGVFGGSDGRHALIRLPNGSIERVSAGDRVQGIQVAAIGADSVRINSRGRDTLLTLPE